MIVTIRRELCIKVQGPTPRFHEKLGVFLKEACPVSCVQWFTELIRKI